MPELPEVEALRKRLTFCVPGQRIVDVLSRTPAALAVGVLRDQRIAAVHRRGKVLLFEMTKAPHLVVRFGMSGRLVLRPPDRPHDAFGLELERAWLTFSDHRRFGSFSLVPSLAAAFEELGPDALSPDFSAANLSGLASSRRSIKAVLLDQSIIAGVGNIYACESLFRARLLPARPWRSLASGEIERLVASVKVVLGEAILRGGATLADFRGTEGESGDYDQFFSVYGREGDPCPHCECATGVIRTMRSGRSTYHCPLLQI